MSGDLVGALKAELLIKAFQKNSCPPRLMVRQTRNKEGVL